MKKANVSADAAAMGGDAASGTEYHVFLSFTGADTRSGFIDRLSGGLADAGILVFKDEEDIRIGAEIGREILRAIDNVQICIPIFSKSYASSKWCLQELAAMVESKVKSGGGETILPIFYDVEPRDVRLKTPLYRDALLEHRKSLGSDRVRAWEDALREVGSLSGWEMGSSSLSRVIGELVEVIAAKLKVNCVDVDRYFVRTDQVEAITDLLAIDRGAVLLVGVHGLGGIGKTAIAKAVYNNLCFRFQGCSFLEDVGESSQRRDLVKLQKQLLSDILYPRADYAIANTDEGRSMIMKKLSAEKVLIVLDDVDEKEQIHELIGQYDGFGSGSRIIVTTQKRSVLTLENQIVAYEMEEMTFNRALLLFSRHAFGRDSPPDDYERLSRELVSITGGLPLAVECLGSYLRGRSTAHWLDTWEFLKRRPLQRVRDILMFSYKALDYNIKQIFLDIACFFVNQRKGKAMYMWEACHFCPEFGVSVLINMSLIKIVSGDTIWMHSELRELGREIVRMESPRNLGRRSRLCLSQGSLDVLRSSEGEGNVEALSLAGNSKGLIFTHQEIARLPNLRFLELNGGYLDGNFESSFSMLRYLSWHCCPPDFKATNLYLRNLVVLDLSESDITDDWGGWNQIKMAKNLKVLDLTGCGNITRTPEFSGYLSLEKMILSGCVKLREIDLSIGKMEHLTCLSLKGCISLEVLPREIGSLESLNELNLWNTRIRELPDSIGKLKKINVVMMERSKMKDLPLTTEMVEKCEELHESQSMEKELLQVPLHAGGQSEREAMNPALSMLALAFCFMVLASISPIQPVIFIALIVLAVIADAVTRTRTKRGLVSSPPVPPSSSSFSPSSFSSSNLSSISISSRTNPEVFLSFRGPDTCKVFADCLYTRLIDSGINVFRDSNDLHPGEKICDALLESIKQCKVSIPIISKDYTSSRHCLMELAQMLECEKANNQSIVPIFYDINLSDIKNQRGCVGESLRKHENRGVDRKDSAEWKQALREIAKRKGYNLPNSKNGHQGKHIKTVVSCILQLLNEYDLVATGNLVGIEPHVREVMRKLGVIYVNEEAMEVCDKDVRVLGICGMPGIGKTTLAKVVYKEVRHLFQGRSYLSNIRENVESNGLMGLQEQLISDLQKQEYRRPSTREENTKVIANSFSKMKVLIFLDDVQDFDHIRHLVGKISWFGLGSRILMTVRRKDVLDAYRNGVADEYEVEPMRPYQALQLFRKHAFHGCPPEEEHEYDFLFTDIIDIIGGLPPAIEVAASYLYEMRWDIEIWREQLHNLGRKLDNKVKKTFEVSYNCIDEETREIFLDIACFFSGMDKRIPSYMWRAADFYPSRGIKFLRDMCLIKIAENNELWMHNQLREFGREIVRMENPKKPRKRSRLWIHSDALSTLIGKKSATNVKALCLAFDAGQGECFRSEAFGHLSSVRYLRLDQATVEGSSQNVLSKLRWLQWQGCRQTSELLIFHLEKLIILDLSYSSVTGDSREWRQILEKARQLKVLILHGCPRLHASPDFYASTPIERLVLERCLLLSVLSRSIGNLKNLLSLNLKFCKFVKHLPEELCYMTALEELLIDGTSISIINFGQASMQRLKILSACQCESLVCISDSIGHLKSLSYLGLDGAAIDSLPDSIGSLKKLQKLLLGNCRKLVELPYSIGNLESLEAMHLSSTAIARLPRSLTGLKKLKVLKMENTLLREFPKDIKYLKMLEEIDLSQCKNLKGPIRCDFKGLSSLKIFRLSSTKTSGLPWSDDRFSDRQTLKLLSHLQQLDLSDCNQVRALPILPSSLTSLRWGSKKMRTVPDLSYLPNMKELHLGDGTNLETKSFSEPPQIGWVTSLVNLEVLELCHSKITTLPENFSALPLRKLVLHYADLLDLRELPPSLSILCLQYCTIRVPQFSKMRYLSELELKNCDLAKIDGLEDLKLLQLLHISHCSVRTLDGLESMPRLRKLTLFDCPSLTEFPDPKQYRFEVNMCCP